MRTLVVRFVYCLLLTGTVLVTYESRAEPALMIKNDNVRKKPFVDAPIVVQVKNGQKLDLQKREGSWYYVKVGAATGWAPMLSIRRTAQPPAVSGGSLSKVSTGRSATGGVVATTGVRGLNEGELKAAAFSEEAIAAAEKNRVSKADAAAFACAESLRVRDVPSLSALPLSGGNK